MRSALGALIWEIWQRGKRAALLAMACLGLCALVNLTGSEKFHASETVASLLSPLYGLLMVISFLLLFGIFNYTEFNNSKEWNGFPYRLFVLPVRTWQLAAIPVFLGVVCTELLYFGWIKLVFSRQNVPTALAGWFAVVLGAYMVFYLAALWSLAGFRIARILVLGLGGTSSIAVACLPIFAIQIHSPWLAEGRLIAIIVALAIAAFGIAWATLARQRCGGGRRRSHIKALAERIIDALPRRSQNFASPAGAQFWFEWRQSGLLLPLCTAFALVFIVGPISWAERRNPHHTMNTLLQLCGIPIVLAFAIGKGFVKPEFWSTNLSIPTFLAVRPLPAGQFVVSKMKVAALSVVISWLLVVGFTTLWLSFWADLTDLKQLLEEFRILYAHSWWVIILLYVAGFMVLSWRCLVSWLWAGLSGSRSIYVGTLCLQVVVPVLLILAACYWSDDIDRQIKEHPTQTNSLILTALGWILAAMVITRSWLTVFSWRKISSRRIWQYLVIWSSATLAFIALAILSCPPFDTYRLEHLYVLAALLLFPFARLGLAPTFLARNRHQ